MWGIKILYYVKCIQNSLQQKFGLKYYFSFRTFIELMI